MKKRFIALLLLFPFVLFSQKAVLKKCKEKVFDLRGTSMKKTIVSYIYNNRNGFCIKHLSFQSSYRPKRDSNKQTNWSKVQSYETLTLSSFDSVKNLSISDTWNYTFRKHHKDKEHLWQELSYYKNKTLLKKYKIGNDSNSSNSTITYFYDSIGNPIKQIDSTYTLRNPTEFIIGITTFQYDSLKRVIKMSYSNSNEKFKLHSPVTYTYIMDTKQQQQVFINVQDGKERKAIYFFDKYGNLKRNDCYTNNKLTGYIKYINTYY